VDLIFDGDRQLYGDLRTASDLFEHGYASFGEVQAAAHASADKAFGCVRRAILREIGVDAASPVLSPRYAEPLDG
jgi:hypothetical protein